MATTQSRKTPNTPVLYILLCMFFSRPFRLRTSLPNHKWWAKTSHDRHPRRAGEFPVSSSTKATGAATGALKRGRLLKEKACLAKVDNAGMRGVRSCGSDDYTMPRGRGLGPVKGDQKSIQPLALCFYAGDGSPLLAALTSAARGRSLISFFAFTRRRAEQHLLHQAPRNDRVHIFKRHLDVSARSRHFTTPPKEGEGAKNVKFHEIKGAHHGYDQQDPVFYLPNTSILVRLSRNPGR